MDAELITDEAKSLAQSIYMKKKMYYNMRMKTLKRNATNVMHEAEEIFKQKLSSVNVTLNMLLKKKKDVEGFLEMNRYRVMEGEDSGEDTKCNIHLELRLNPRLLTNPFSNPHPSPHPPTPTHHRRLGRVR